MGATEVTFVPGDPPRTSRLAFLDDDGATTTVTAVLLAGSAMRRQNRKARLVSVEDALSDLIAAEDTDSHSARAWAAVLTAGASLVARGRLLPQVTGHGFDGWRVGPLDPADWTLLRELGAALPPAAHCVPLSAKGPIRLSDPIETVRAAWDALADGLARATDAGLPFVGTTPVPAAHLADWVEIVSGGVDHGARVGLRLELPAVDDSEFAAVLQVRSEVDPSLVVDAADLWAMPDVVLERLGDDAETALLLAMRRGAAIWPPLGRLLGEARPDRVALDDEEVAWLLLDGSAALAATGVELLLPSELANGQVTVRAVVGTPAPASATNPVLKLDDLLNVRWEAVFGGEALTKSELDALAEAKRPLIRLRGQWVAPDPELLERLRRRQRARPRKLTTLEALAVALTGVLDEGGALGVVEVRPQGALVDLASTLRNAVAGAGVRVDTNVAPIEPEGFVGTLRGYQRTALAWLVEMCELRLGGCLALDMGLGKTAVAIALHLHRARGPLLVVCPASLLGNWEREIAKFAPGLVVRRYHEGERHLDQLGPTEVVLATYGIVRRDHEVLAEVPWDLAVADEAQHVKNPMSRGAKAIRAIPAVARVALTGTPVENRLSDLWAILDWTTPGLLGPLDRFRRDVAIPIERHRDPEATERLVRLVRPFVHRRQKSDPDVAPELPAKTETDVVVPLTPEQVTLYEAVVRESLAEIAESEGMARRGLVLRLLTQLKQICNHPAHFLKEAGPLAKRSGKLDALDELVDVIRSERESVLVFTQYVAMARLLERHLEDAGIGTLFLHGGVAARSRDTMVGRFQAGEVPVFLLSLKAGGVGLNLTRATHVVHYDRWWNPAVEDQATDRAHRIGQDRPVVVHRLVSEGTVEDRIAALIASKRELVSAVVGTGGEAWISELSDDDLADLVSLGAS